jgi:hypothetical protein
MPGAGEALRYPELQVVVVPGEGLLRIVFWESSSLLVTTLLMTMTTFAGDYLFLRSMLFLLSVERLNSSLTTQMMAVNVCLP